jgi:hypothetical protein
MVVNGVMQPGFFEVNFGQRMVHDSAKHRAPPLATRD